MAAVEKTLANQGFQLADDIVISADGAGLKHLLRAGQGWLEAHVNVVNGLNVFPVPDGDTGTNLVLTMRSAMAHVAEAADDNVATIAAAAAQGALMGARGNSGVILSQFLRGLASSFEGHTVFTVGDFARAAQVGVQEAYKSVVKPVEGTILTVARAAADAARQNAATNDDLVAHLTEVVAAAKIAQAETPELLPVLKEAGVTDSGGQGLVYILEGSLRFLRGEPVDLDPAGEAAPLLQSSLGADEEAYGYDVQFLIQGESLDVGTIRQQIDSLGWSTVVVGDERLVKVHVHSRDPGVPISYGASQGIISDVVVENMETQAKEFVHGHLATAGDPVGEIATVAVVPGSGLAQIFKS
ncbi:MAG TPA: DAK2 domain-containing protein, partial [Anaerolineae bacterium]